MGRQGKALSGAWARGHEEVCRTRQGIRSVPCGRSLVPGLWKWTMNSVQQPRGLQTWLMNSGLRLQLSEFPPARVREISRVTAAGPGGRGSVTPASKDRKIQRQDARASSP